MENNNKKENTNKQKKLSALSSTINKSREEYLNEEIIDNELKKNLNNKCKNFNTMNNSEFNYCKYSF